MRAAAVWINRLLWTFIVTVVVVVGAVVGLGRHYIDYVDDYQNEIVATVEQHTGLHLQVEKLSARWMHVSPQFTIDNLKLFNPAKPDEVVLDIDHLVVRVGLLQSLANFTPVFSLVEGEGAVAQLDEVTPGHFQLRGFPSRGSIDPLIDAMLRIHRAAITASRADLHFVGGRSAQLDAQNVQLQRTGNFRRLNLELQVTEDGAAVKREGAPLKVVVEAHGDPRDSGRFSARGYAEFAKVDLTPLLPMASSYGFDLKHGRIDGAAWLDWQGDDISVRGRVALPVLDLAGITGRDLPAITQIAAPFLLRSRDGHQQLWLPRISAQWGGENIDIASMLIARDVGAPVFSVSLPQVKLDDVQRVLRAGHILSDHLTQVLDELAPSGALRNLQLQLPMAPEHRDQLRVRTEIAALKVSPWHGAPGLVGISGFLDTGLAGGTAILEGVDAQLDFPHVYHQPIPFKTLRGALNWHLDGDRVLVESGPIAATGEAGLASILLTLNLNTHAGDPVPPQMTLMVGMRNSAAQFRNWFIPYTLSPKLLSWLDHSIGSGQLPRGAFIYNGSLRAGDHDHRSVELFLDVENGELNYHPEWPALHALSAEVWLDNTDLDVRGRSARMFDQVQLSDIDVAMRPLEGGGEWLRVTGDVVARDNDMLRVLRESALQKNLNGALDHWNWRGIARAQLDLGIPIGGPPIGEQPIGGDKPGGEHILTPDIRVDAELDDGTLQLTDVNLTLEHVDGPLRYRSDGSQSGPDEGGKVGLYSAGIDARLYDRAAKIRISSDEHHATQIHATGKVAMPDLRNWLQQPLLDHAQGETAFNLAIKLNGDSSNLQVTSDLAGVAINLPAPYHKSADETLPLQVTMPLRGERQVAITAGDWADLSLLWKTAADGEAPATATEKRVLRSGVLRLGKTGDATHASGKLVITGTVPQVDLNPWRELLANNRGKIGAASSAEATTPETAATTAPVETAAATPALAVSLRDLQLPDVDAAGFALRDVHVSGEHSAGDHARGDAPGWSLQVRADKLSGSATIPDDTQKPLRLDFAELHLPAASPDTEPAEPPQPSALSKLDPAVATAIDVRIHQLWRGDENWGDIGFRLRPITHGLRLDQLSGRLRGIDLQPVGTAPAQLTWQRRDDIHTTRFVGRLAVGDIADVLARWGFEKTMSSRSGFLETDVSWIGAPDEIGLKKLDGVATVNLHEGQFLKASGSATGALKVVGVFNFANLLRRLQLDFSDLFKGGVSFDDIEGQLAMSNGVFRSHTPIEINSPSSHFRLTGQIDFASDLADMELVATLPIASNLPWMVALAGGLPAAAGVYVASKLFEQQVDHFSSAVYEIRGPWREPEVKFRRMFDDQLPKRAPPAQATADERAAGPINGGKP
jgi:uncharacterized protein (TIGR02099 family)